LAADNLIASLNQLFAFKAESFIAHAPGPVAPTSGHVIGLNECASVHGAATWQEQGYDGSGSDLALLVTFTFTSTAAATAAEAGVLAGMQQCQSTSRALQSANHVAADAVCTETAQSADADAFSRTWTSVPGFSAGGPEINHLYIGVEGTTIVVLELDEHSPSASSAGNYSVRHDPAVLTMLSSMLAAHIVGS
jgi:hypothetical protein